MKLVMYANVHEIYVNFTDQIPLSTKSAKLKTDPTNQLHLSSTLASPIDNFKSYLEIQKSVFYV